MLLVIVYLNVVNSNTQASLHCHAHKTVHNPIHHNIGMGGDTIGFLCVG